MRSSNLIARIHLRDGFGNASALSLREGPNRELVTSLATHGGLPESLGNLQLREPLPAFWSGSYGAVLSTVAKGIGRSVRKVERIETSPTIDFEAEL